MHASARTASSRSRPTGKKISASARKRRRLPRRERAPPASGRSFAASSANATGARTLAEIMMGRYREAGLLLVIGLTAAAASAQQPAKQVYKYVDEQGRVVYSQTPP